MPPSSCNTELLTLITAHISAPDYVGLIGLYIFLSLLPSLYFLHPQELPLQVLFFFSGGVCILQIIFNWFHFSHAEALYIHIPI